MALLGYAKFSGIYGEFTIPVFEAPDFTITSDVLAASILRLSTGTYNSIRWNKLIDIWGLYRDYQEVDTWNSVEYINPFELDSSPVCAIIPYYNPSGSEHEYLTFWRNRVSKYWECAFDIFEDNSTELVACIFKFPDMGDKYFFAFEDDKSLNIEGTAATFTFISTHYDSIDNRTFDSFEILPNPIIIGEEPVPEPVPEPDNIIIDPSPAYMALNTELQFTAKYTYDNGDEIQVTPSNGKWSVEDDNGEPLESGVSISDDGLVSLGDFNNSKFYVKVAWEGISYNVTKSIPVYISDSPASGNIYTPGIGNGIPSWPSGVGGIPSFPSGGGGNLGIINGVPEQSDNVANSLPGIGTPSGSFEGSVANSGLFVHYAMNSDMLKKVGDWLWTSDLGLVIAKEFMSILYGSPIESAISLMSYPFNVTALNGVVANTQRIVWGSQQLTDTLGDIRAPAITNPYATIDWGTVQLTEFWGNFLDYSPHTKLELYLPWCTGFVPIDPNECLPGTLRVVTNIELSKGTCLHNVIGNDGRIIATHAGTCGKQLPLTALDTSGKALSLVSTAVSMAVAGGAGAAANRAGEIAGANYMAGAHQLGMTPSQAVSGAHGVRHEAMAPHLKTQNRARNMALAGSAAATRTPSHVQRSGSFSGSAAGLGIQFPYLIISRPTQSVPTQYGHHYGYPSNIYTPLANLHGYTEVGEIHLNGFVCTEEELEEIDSLLKGGVIL